MWNDQTKKVKTIAALAIAMALSATSVVAAERAWTRSTILKIADRVVKKEGLDPEASRVTITAYNPAWKTYDELLGELDVSPEVKARLQKRNFWAITYSPLSDLTLGNGAIVFIDRETGEVLDFMGYE